MKIKKLFLKRVCLRNAKTYIVLAYIDRISRLRLIFQLQQFKVWHLDVSLCWLETNQTLYADCLCANQNTCKWKSVLRTT